MLFSLKRRRILRGREEAVAERHQAARDFVAAIREAEAALEAIRAANDKLYRSDIRGEQEILSSLRSGRERTFAFHASKEIASIAPLLTRALGVRVAHVQAPSFLDFIAATSAADFDAIDHGRGSQA
jgi:hypothetical protein